MIQKVERQSAFELAASERREQDRINKLIEEERLKMIEKVSQAKFLQI